MVQHTNVVFITALVLCAFIYSQIQLAILNMRMLLQSGWWRRSLANQFISEMYSHHMQPLCANMIEIPFSIARSITFSTLSVCVCVCVILLCVVRRWLKVFTVHVHCVLYARKGDTETSHLFSLYICLPRQ